MGLQAPQYPAREGIWTGKEPLLPRPAKHSDTIAKHIIKVSSYSRILQNNEKCSRTSDAADDLYEPK